MSGCRNDLHDANQHRAFPLPRSAPSIQTMKYPQLMRMPSDVSEWLEEQLEQRGIDAIVYTRYVLSLLLYSSGNTASDQLCTWQQQQDMRRRTNTGAEEAERQRRLAAVNCLVAASDQPHHIEALVDELCDRLKRVNADTTEAATVTPAPAQTTSSNMSRHDLARRYYAAFPALQGSSSSNNVILVQQEKWPLKRHGKEMNLATPPSKHRYTDGKRREAKRLDYATAAMKKRQMVFQRPPGIDRNWFITSRLEDWHTHNTSFNTLSNNVTSTTMTIANTPANDYMMINNDALALDIVRDILDDSSDIYTSTNLCYSNNMLSFNNNNNTQYITSGTNIITSIWSSSEDDMTGWLVDKNGLGMCLLQEEEVMDGYSCKWSEAADYESQMLVLKSLEILNHTQECSGFCEVMPKKQSFQPYIFPPIEHTSEPTEELEDLLHSAATHFRPISSTTRSHAQPQYADGTTFYVNCTLDKLSYERSEDGASMFLDTVDGGGRVEYMSVAAIKDEVGLQLKFRVGSRLNDKACQTDDDDDEEEVKAVAEEFFFPGDLELLMDEEVELDENEDELRSEDNCIMEELFGKREMCDKCSTTTQSTAFLAPSNNQLKSIWDAGELCVACLRLNAHSSGNGSNTGNDMPSERKDNNQQHEDLRYDVTKDGEQLLSDLSSIQNRYMMDEERYYYGNKVLQHYDYPNELTTVGSTGADCSGHHPVLHSASFSFASRLQEDCLIKMATMPTLRSVTL